MSSSLPLLRVFVSGGLSLLWSGARPPLGPSWHLDDGFRREQADRGAEQILHGAVVSEDPAHVQQQHPQPAATGTEQGSTVYFYSVCFQGVSGATKG